MYYKNVKIFNLSKLVQRGRQIVINLIPYPMVMHHHSNFIISIENNFIN